MPDRALRAKLYIDVAINVACFYSCTRLNNTQTAMAEPVTPATLSTIACINKKLPDYP